MKPSNRSLFALTFLLAIVPAFTSGSSAQEGSAPAGAEPLKLSLMDCIREAFKNNKDIRVDSYRPLLSDTDIAFQKAQFDANLTATAFYQDQESPTLGVDRKVKSPQANTVIGTTPSNFTRAEVTYADPLTTGGRWQADVRFDRNVQPFFSFGPTVSPLEFPSTYRTTMTLSFSQPLLRNFGRKVSETQIVLTSLNNQIDQESFRKRVQDTLLAVEDAYWTLVYTHQNLQVQKEALELAQELLKLNQIKVQVGTLPPIDITQAEAGVASKEESVIIAEADIENAQDVLRRVIGFDPQSQAWKTSILPVEDFTLPRREVDYDQSVKTAVDNRPDLAAERLRIKSADTALARDKNQLKYSLNLDASYSLVGLAGDRGVLLPNGTFPFRVPPDNAQGFGNTTQYITGAEFPTYFVQLTLGIPIGNHAAEATYSRQRLSREQEGISYSSLEQAAIVEVGLAVRRVQTDSKRIEAAEKNRILQEKKVEAEQKKFENGMSTSFQVLTFQNDLADARSREIQAKTSYRVSLANLDNVIGVIDKTLNVNIGNYVRD